MKENIKINPETQAFECIDRFEENNDFKISPYGFGFKEYCDIRKLDNPAILYFWGLSCYEYPMVIFDIRVLCSLANIPCPTRMQLYKSPKYYLKKTLRQIEDAMQKDIREIVFCKD